MANKPDFLFSQAGALPYVVEGGVFRIVLITSRSSGKWIFPKGVIDPGETAESTAVKESFEEAGLIGELTGGSLGSYRQEKWGGVAQVEVFPMLVESVLEEWDEQATRDRVVVAPEEAKRLVASDLAAIIEAFETIWNP